MTDPARAVVIDAVDRAHLAHTKEVGADHLLAAVLSAASVQPLLDALNLLHQTDLVMAEIQRAYRRGGLSSVDAAALANLGIDLDAIVDRVETDLGEGALDDNRRPPRRLGPTISPGVKRALRAAERQAAARGGRDLTVADLLLGLLAQPGVVTDTLAGRGCTVATVLAVLDVPPAVES